jgi:hypothetical protein
MAFISDILLTAGAFGAAIYCLVLSRRLRKFTDLEGDIGKAISILSTQMDELNLSLHSAQKSADLSVKRLNDGTNRAETAARHLELLVASLHSLPQKNDEKANSNPFFARRDFQDVAAQ